MMASDGQLSSYLAIKGALVETTYRAFSDWDLSLAPTANLERIKATNSVGASSEGWLKQFIRVVNQRYDLVGRDRPLIELVQQGWHIDDWRPVQLWHMARSDELLRVFLVNWLFEQRENGIVLISTEAVIEFLQDLVKKRLGSGDAWKENTYRRVASGLLKMAAEFHLMRGRVNKEFESYRLPERSLTYLLYVLMDRESNTRKVIHAEDWRLYLMKPHDVEEELLRLHQYGKLRFERAGSFFELTLPCENSAEYIGRAGL